MNIDAKIPKGHLGGSAGLSILVWILTQVRISGW